MVAMRIKSALVLMALSLGSVAADQSGEFWQKKEYRRWSEKECKKLLEDSPWAQKHTLSEVFIDSTAQPGSDTSRFDPYRNQAESQRPAGPLERSSTERARESRPQLYYQAQFRSALPIRRAVVRMSQINARYDEMQSEQQQAFDKKAEEFLAKRFPATVMLHITYGSNVQFDDRNLTRHWRSQTIETLKNFVFLILPGGEKIPVTGYAVSQGAGREFQFEFPREHQGRPLVGPEDKDKALQLEFVHPGVRGQSGSRVLISFKVEKMLFDGKVVY